MAKKRRVLAVTNQLNVKVDRKLLDEVEAFRENELRPYEAVWEFVERALRMRVAFLRLDPLTGVDKKNGL